MTTGLAEMDDAVAAAFGGLDHEFEPSSPNGWRATRRINGYRYRLWGTVGSYRCHLVVEDQTGSLPMTLMRAEVARLELLGFLVETAERMIAHDSGQPTIEQMEREILDAMTDPDWPREDRTRTLHELYTQGGWRERRGP